MKNIFRKTKVNLISWVMIMNKIRPSLLQLGRGSIEINAAAGVYIIQIMTDHEGNRKIYLAQGIQEGLETVDYCLRRSRG